MIYIRGAKILYMQEKPNSWIKNFCVLLQSFCMILQMTAFCNSLNIIVNNFLKIQCHLLLVLRVVEKNHIYKRVDKLQRDIIHHRRAEERLLYLVDWSITFLVERNLLARPPFKRKLTRELFRTYITHAAWKHHLFFLFFPTCTCSRVL